MRLLLDAAVLSFALLLRILVGFQPHSGQDDYQGPNAAVGTDASKPAKYGGDYEAQRHWMEITHHLPMGEWYHHDLEYWGLDYPPLTAYHSWLCGWAAHNLGAFGDSESGNEVCQWDDSKCIDKMQKRNAEKKYSRGLGVLKDLVALNSSRWGFEDSGGKMYMRFTVLLFDVLVYMSAVWMLVTRLTKQGKDGPKQSDTETTSTSAKKDGPIVPITQQPRLRLLLYALSQPALILIDHGHFQYNTISLGLALWSFHFMTQETHDFVGPIVGSILFSLALNFKQMELYHAPAVFAYLLGRCFRNDKSNKLGASTAGAVGRFFALGQTVIATFAMLWLPFALYPRDTAASSLVQIIRRLFPFQRGIFEGKVANLWCALSIKPFSIRDRVPSSILPLAALGLTLALILPPCWILFRVGKAGASGDSPTSKSNQVPKLNGGNEIKLLLWGSASTSLAFFLASFQVHEKGILIALAPISVLAMDAPGFVFFFSILTTWSLWPLLVIDRLTDAYVCCLVIFLCIDRMTKVPVSQFPSHDESVDIFSDRYVTRYIPTLSWLAMVMLHVSELMVVPPSHLPDLFPVLWSFVGCGLFIISYLGTVWAMASHSQMEIQIGHTKKRKSGKRATAKGGLVSMLGIFLISSAESSEAFVPSSWHYHGMATSYTGGLRLSNGKGEMEDIITPDLLDRARLPLGWELQIAKEAKPVLNLSQDTDILSLADGAGECTSPVQGAAASEENNQQDSEPWQDGSLWKSTEQQLEAIGILGTGSKLTPREVMDAAPQLLRLTTHQVIEAASFLVSWSNSTALLEADPSLLTYCLDDLEYGLSSYLPNMMFMGNGTLASEQIQMHLSLSPSMALQLVRMGIEGGMEERSVSRALGNAGKASGKAVESIVGEAGRSYREWKRFKGGKRSLG